MAATWRALRRWSALTGHIAQAVWMARGAFQRLDAPAQQRWVEQWAQGFLRKAGVGLWVQGQPCATAPVLWVANHQSWLDIPSLHAARYSRFIAKAEIAHWPVAGKLAHTAGTLFIARHSRRAMQHMVQAMAQALAQGDSLTVFPEGTVGNGRDLLPFHANTLQAAIDAQVAIQPVALRFVDARSGAPVYAPCEAWPDEPMWRSLWRTLQTEHLVAVVSYGAVETAQGRDRRAWAQALQAQVQALRSLPVQPGPE